MLAAVIVMFHSLANSLRTLACGWMLVWRWGSKSVALVGMGLLVVEGSSSTAAAGMAPELVLWGKVGSSMSGRVAAVVAVDNLNAAAPNELSRKKTFW